MELAGKRVLVFGCGKSGIGSSQLLLKKNAQVILYDGNEDLSKEKILGEFPDDEIPRINILLGELKDERIKELDLCVLSPGVPTDLDTVCRIREAEVPIIGEVELAYSCSKGELAAITGTNGKTTTTAILGEIMKKALGSEHVFVVGNIGNPYTSAALLTDESSFCVAEISSFQLETMQSFHPKVCAITNITPDHLNRHHTMEEYIRVKESIIKNQTPADTVVLNYEDKELNAFGKRIEGKVKVAWFSSERELEEGIYLRGREIVWRAKGSKDAYLLAGTDELKLLGKHNYENIAAAALCALECGVSAKIIRDVLLSFEGVEHRIEYVDEVRGVRYYNDSKGTNPDAAIKAVQAMERPTVLIGGGYDKDSTYDEWIRSFDGKIKALVLIGATKEKIADCAAKHGFDAVTICESFREAFDKCVELAEEGDAVLLSPACASWGMFKNYEERGRVFKEYVAELSQDNK